MGQIEIDEYCQEILKKHWKKVPRWSDITRVTVADIRRRCGRIDLITGGFPCQDISTAGKGAGITEGQRSSLWWEMWRLIRELRPDWLLLENVPALRTNGADSVLSSLEAIGYTCWPLVVGAWHAGAAHKRNRVWIIANRSTEPDGNSGAALKPDANRAKLRNKSGRSSGKKRKGATGFGIDSHRFSRAAWADVPQHEWEAPRAVKSDMGGTVHGIPRRLALKALGNANPPIMAYLMGKAILEVRNL